MCRVYYEKMKAAGGGVIINDIGNAGENYDPDYIAGTTGNASLMAFTRALGGRSLEDNIRVVGVNPGRSIPRGSTSCSSAGPWIGTATKAAGKNC